MNEKEGTIDIPWIRTHFGDEKPETDKALDPDYVAMLEELEYK